MALALKLFVTGTVLATGLLVSRPQVQSAPASAPRPSVIAAIDEEQGTWYEGRASAGNPCVQACSIGDVLGMAPH